MSIPPIENTAANDARKAITRLVPDHEFVVVIRGKDGRGDAFASSPGCKILDEIRTGGGNRHHEAKADRMGISADYVIWSNEHRGWWGPDERGYVRSLTEAGRYSQARAMAIAGSQWAMPFDGIPNEIAMRLDDALEQVRGPNR